MKAFHLLLFYGSFIFPLMHHNFFNLILLPMIDSTPNKKDISWLYTYISSLQQV